MQRVTSNLVADSRFIMSKKTDFTENEILFTGKLRKFVLELQLAITINTFDSFRKVLVKKNN